MHHLMEQRLNGFVPAVTTNVSPADNDLRAISLLPAKCVVTEPGFHPPRNANRNGTQLTAELREIQLAMRAREIADKALIRRMRALDRTLLTRRRWRATRIEIE